MTGYVRFQASGVTARAPAGLPGFQAAMSQRGVESATVDEIDFAG